MPELPTGTVTLLFTDIEGSTKLLHELGERYGDVLAEHRSVLREAFFAHKGVEVDTQGEAFFVAFSRAKDAVAAAEQAQRAMAQRPVRVRIGIHTGKPIWLVRATSVELRDPTSTRGCPRRATASNLEELSRRR